MPVVVRREIDGFVLNRLQGALLSEAMRLVGEGYVISPEDLDKTVARRARTALVVHGAVRDDRTQRAGRRRRLLRALQRVLSAPGRGPAGAGACGTARAPSESSRRSARPRRPMSANDCMQWRDRRLLALRRHKRRTIRRPTRSETMIGNLMAAKRKVIITCAVTGSIHTPSMSPYLPITPKEIADAAVGAAEAGAAIVHLHARDPVDGHPTQDPKLLPRVRRRTSRAEATWSINFTTGGAPTMTVEERLQPALQLKPEVASLNMGSMNFGLYPMLERFKEFKLRLGAPVPRRLR